MKPLARWAVFSLTMFILTLSTVPSLAQTHVTSFTISGQIIGSSTQTAPAMIQIQRDPSDVSSDTVRVVGGANITCPLMNSDGCVIPGGATSTTGTVSAGWVSQSTTYTMTASVENWNDPGLNRQTAFTYDAERRVTQTKFPSTLTRPPPADGASRSRRLICPPTTQPASL
jgi:hypothetical protein